MYRSLGGYLKTGTPILTVTVNVDLPVKSEDLTRVNSRYVQHGIADVKNSRHLELAFYGSTCHRRIGRCQHELLTYHQNSIVIVVKTNYWRGIRIRTRLMTARSCWRITGILTRKVSGKNIPKIRSVSYKWRQRGVVEVRFRFVRFKNQQLGVLLRPNLTT